MEKISFFDLLTILIPGALFALFIEYFFILFDIQFIEFEMNQYFKLTVFLSSAIILGSLINIITRKVFDKPYQKINMHKSILHYYNNSKEIKPLHPFFNKMIDNLCGKKKITKNENDKKKNEYDRIERLWSEIYYEMEAKDQIKNPKSYQSFYFFFRNFFTLSIIFIVFIAVIQVADYNPRQLYWMIGADITALFTSYIAARWNRKKMIERMFWTYYSLYKKK